MIDLEFFLGHYPYYMVALLLGIGVWGMLGKRNLLKKIIGMTIFQTAIYLFFIQGATKLGATLPVFDPEIGTDPTAYVNPLPHVVVLTALVVGVAISAVALSLLLVTYRTYGSLDEGIVLERMREEGARRAEEAPGSAGARPGFGAAPSGPAPGAGGGHPSGGGAGGPQGPRDPSNPGGGST